MSGPWEDDYRSRQSRPAPDVTRFGRGLYLGQGSQGVMIDLEDYHRVIAELDREYRRLIGHK